MIVQSMAKKPSTAVCWCKGPVECASGCPRLLQMDFPTRKAMSLMLGVSLAFGVSCLTLPGVSLSSTTRGPYIVGHDLMVQCNATFRFELIDFPGSLKNRFQHAQIYHAAFAGIHPLRDDCCSALIVKLLRFHRVSFEAPVAASASGVPTFGEPSNWLQSNATYLHRAS